MTEPVDSQRRDDAGDLIVLRPEGLYCPAGDFHIDPWRPVARAVITHAHADHARSGHGAYLATAVSEGVLRARLGADIPLQGLAYGEPVMLNGVRVSLHPAGHVLGSAQVRVEHRGRGVGGLGRLLRQRRRPRRQRHLRAVRAGALRVLHHRVDLRPADLPLARAGRGAARHQRLVAGQCRQPGAPACCSATASARRSACWPGSTRRSGRSSRTARSRRSTPPIARPAWRCRRRAASTSCRAPSCKRAIALAPPAVQGSVWARRLGDDASDAFASGWMQLRGARRRQGVDRGFVLSDHADWPGLQRAIARHRRRARDRHPRLRGGDGALAAAARACRRKASPPRTATMRSRPTPPHAARTDRDMKAFAALFDAARRQHVDRAQGRRDAALLHSRAGGRRRVGRVLSGRRQAAPDRAHRGAAQHRVRRRRHRRLAVRGLLPGGGRSGRDHRARAAAAPTTTPHAATPAWPNGSSSACCRCAASRLRCRPRRCAAGGGSSTRPRRSCWSS